MEAEQRLQEAIQYVQDHPEDSVHSIARRFDVKRTTLRGRVKGARPRKGRPGPNKLFSETEEKAICNYIDRYTPDRSNPTVRPEFVTDIANVILAARHSPSNPDPPTTVGTNWTSRFLKRHGYAARTQKQGRPENQAAGSTDPTAAGDDDEGEGEGEGESDSPSSSTPSSPPSPTTNEASSAATTEGRIPITLPQLNEIAGRIEETLNEPEIGFTPELSHRLTRLVKSALLNTSDLLQVKPSPSHAKHAELLQKQRQRQFRRDKEEAREVRKAQKILDAHVQRVRKAARRVFAEAAKESRRRRIVGQLEPAEVVDSRSGPKWLRRC